MNPAQRFRPPDGGGTEIQKEKDVALAPTLPCAGDNKELPLISLTFLGFSYNIVIEGIHILYHNPYIIIIYPANNYVNDW